MLDGETEMRQMSRLGFILVLVGACVFSTAWADVPLYSEQYRPQLHFSPPQQWMNDPNGLLYYRGTYHLFYQYNPYSTKWGPMHWGHAVSSDLVHWTNRPIALFPDQHGAIFSGSAVVDAGDTSGFGTKGHPPLVAVFTYDNFLKANLGETGYQSQGLAYSLDGGRTWVKYARNPVLRDPQVRNFRDPKVFWYAPRHDWIMTLAAGDHVSFYSSPDLKHWTRESNFGRRYGAHFGVWECPDLLEIPVAGERAKKAVLLVSINPGGPNGGSATQYFIGTFDGHAFRLDQDLQGKLAHGRDSSGDPVRDDAGTALWLDYGTDNYAGSTWSGGPPGDDRVLFVGWMNNWEYANNVPAGRWRGQMTLPRQLRLVRTSVGLRVESAPVSELKSLRLQKFVVTTQAVRKPIRLTPPTGIKSGLMELELELDSRDARTMDLTLSNGLGEHTTFRIDRGRRRYSVDRSASGAVMFNPAFRRVQTAPIIGNAKRTFVHLFVDRSSLEVFINHGETVFTTLGFPSKPYDTVTLSADQPVRLESGAIYALKSIWTGR